MFWIEAFLFESPLSFLVLQKDDLEKIDGFQTPSRNAFSPDNVSSRTVPPTRVDAPSVPWSRGDSRTLPSKGRLAAGSGSSSVLNTSLPPTPSPTPQGGMNSPRASIISTDSGIGTSVGGEVRRPLRKSGSTSMPNSGSGVFERGSGSSGSGSSTHHSADAEFRHRVAVSSICTSSC